MSFFKKRKLRLIKVSETKKNMLDLFNKKVKDNENYSLLYGYTPILDKNGYVYQNKIIAYREEDMTLLVLETDKDFKKVKHLKK